MYAKSTNHAIKRIFFQKRSFLFSLSSSLAKSVANVSLNLTQGVSPISRDAYELHMMVFWICVAIGVVVFGAMFYSIIYHRRSKHPTPARFHSHTVIEIAWTIIPAIILI